MDVDSYIDSIARALAQRSRGRGGGRATAMIGAGFSRNAQKLTESAHNFPLWRDIVRPLIDELLPQCRDCGGIENCPVDKTHPPDACRRRAHLFADAAGASGMMALGDKFEAKKGSARLRAALESAVPDRDYGPGRAHQLLVRLPWADILTTNWDSLLERAVDAYDRSYDTVITVKQIASAIAPRIVKLHGCARSGTDLIFTEESFRTYPKDYAPFVSLVQQSLMENVVVLFGFSGADPNFRAWHGWVRDHLGSNLQPIYMVSLRPTEPIDVNLMAGRLITHINLSEKWSHLDDQRKIESFLEGIQKRLRGLNVNLDWPSDHRVHSETAATKLATGANDWRQRRNSYPGWLIAPAQNRADLVSHLDVAVTIALGDDPPIVGGLAPLNGSNGARKSNTNPDNFLTDREKTAMIVAESLRIALARPGDELWGLLTEILAQALLDLFKTAFDELHPGDGSSATSGMARLSEILAAVLKRSSTQGARDPSESERAAAIINEVANELLRGENSGLVRDVVLMLLPLIEVVERDARLRSDPTTAQTLRYTLYLAGGDGAVRETAIRGALVAALERLDLREIQALLRLWPDQHYDASSNLRHAAVQREIGKIREADREISSTVARLRSLGNERRRGVAESSREAWAFYLYADLIERNLAELELIMRERSTTLGPRDVLEELHERLDELETYRCDPRREMDRLARDFEAATEQARLGCMVLARDPHADVGIDGPLQREHRHILASPANAFMILTETVGVNIQQICRGYPLALMATRLLAQTNRKMAINLLLRAGTPDDLPFAQTDRPTGATEGEQPDWLVAEIVFGRASSGEDFRLLCGLLEQLAAPSRDISSDFIESSYLDRKFRLLQHLIAGLISREDGAEAKQFADLGFALACKIAYSPVVAATRAGWSNSLSLFETALKRFPFRAHAHGILTGLLDLPIPTESNDAAMTTSWPDPIRLLVAAWYPRRTKEPGGERQEPTARLTELGTTIGEAVTRELRDNPILRSVLSDHERRWEAMVGVSSRSRRLIVERRLTLIRSIIEAGDRSAVTVPPPGRRDKNHKGARKSVARSA